MVNELKVFYESDRGLMTFNNKLTVFQHRTEREGVEKGLGIILEDTVCNKGNYAFAVFKNIDTVVPKSYKDIRFFVNRGVPVKIEKGTYGKNVLLKESYKDKTYIRAYKKNGEVGLYESATITKEGYSGPNVYFNRLDDIVGEWTDITNEIVESVVNSVKNLKCSVGLSDETVLNALKGLSRNTIYRLSSGVIIADGKFESLLIWTEGKEVKMAWLGRKLDLSLFEYTDVTEELSKLIAESIVEDKEI